MYRHTFVARGTPILKAEYLPQIEQISHICNNPSWFYTLHLHPHQIELMYVADGQATLTTPQHIFHASESDIFLIDKNVVHSVESNKENPCDIWYFLLSNAEFYQMPQPGSFIAMAKAGDFSAFLDDTLHRIQEFSCRDDRAAFEISNHLAASLLIVFHEVLLDADFRFEVKNSAFAQEVLIYINEHYKEKIDLQQLSGIFYSSASHISNEFKKEYHISPIRYLIDKRLSESRWLLVNTNESVQGIAERVGYTNTYYFTKLFANRIGISPSDYRNAYSAGTPPKSAGNKK